MAKIFISGLTAAGKTTHSKLLASEYDLHYLSASSFLLKRANIDTNNLPKDFWVSPAAMSVRDQRANSRSIDTWVDQQMVEASSALDTVIFDSWGLPWLSQESGLRIWLESSLNSRCWKAIISHGHESIVDPAEILTEISEKDLFTREYFLSSYGFDLFQDHDIFDYIIDITTFIKAPTEKASYDSVKGSQELLTDIVNYHINPHREKLEQLHCQIKRHGDTVFRKIPSITDGLKNN